MEQIIGTTFNVTWSSENLPDNLKIELSRDGGSSWETIVESTENTGSYPWVVTGPITDTAIIRISDIEQPELYGDSNPFFIKIANEAPSYSEQVWGIDAPFYSSMPSAQAAQFFVGTPNISCGSLYLLYLSNYL